MSCIDPWSQALAPLDCESNAVTPQGRSGGHSAVTPLADEGGGLAGLRRSPIKS